MIVRTVLSNRGSINSFRWRTIILRSRSTALLSTSAKRLTSSRDGLPVISAVNLGAEMRAALWVASLSKCDNLFSRPRNRSPPRIPLASLHELHHPRCTDDCPHFVLGVHVFVAPRRRVIVRLTGLTLWHHYDVNERRVSILAGLASDPSIIFRGQASPIICRLTPPKLIPHEISYELFPRHFWHLSRYLISIRFYTAWKIFRLEDSDDERTFWHVICVRN